MNYMLIKALNNNAVLALGDDSRERILLGKGIGFHKNKPIDTRLIERSYVLANEEEKNKYLRRLEEGNPEVYEVVEEILKKATAILGELHPSIFVVLSGHIDFAIKRVQEGIHLPNPLLHEISSLYQEEYSLALAGVQLLNSRLDTQLSDEEAGFIALHLGAARTNEDVKSALRFTNAIQGAMALVKDDGIEIHETHLYRQTIEQLRRMTDYCDKEVTVKNVLLGDIKEKMPEAFSLALDISRLLEEKLECSVPEDETGYLAIHLHYLQGLNNR